MTISYRLLTGAAVAATMLTAAPVHAQDYPTRAITVIIPFAGGSASDVVSRIMFDRMSKSLGQPIIVENKPGAGGNSGTQLASKANPDGYTLVGAGSGPIAANVSLYKNLGYDPVKELAVISPFARFTIVVTVSNKLGVKTIQDLVARAKKEPGALNCGSVGIGSSQHLACEYFNQVAGVKITHVPYKNIAQFGPDLISGQVQTGFQWYPNVAGPINAKGATALAVAGEQRLPALPDTPTTTQAGMPQFKVDGWFALAAPAATPKPILEKLNKALAEAIADPKVRQGFEKAGAVPTSMSLDAAKKFHAAEVDKYRDIITKAGIPKIGS
jgi:tripartite-type tricarboxylate transporter receptor subunit TctC